jgi:hypothetical protein
MGAYFRHSQGLLLGAQFTINFPSDFFTKDGWETTNFGLRTKLYFENKDGEGISVTY